jgi:Cdc6-like AAA superfamily ATPase
MLQDPQLLRAVSQILQRSERQEEVSKLIETFVDVGVLPQLENRNNQILYGRRGTGKTHVLRVLGTRLAAAGHAVLYIDARVLGSTTQFSDANIPMSTRCLAFQRHSKRASQRSLGNAC